MKYVLVYLIKGKAGKYQKTLIKNLADISEERYMIENPLPPHVTLKSPFEMINIKKLERVVSEFASRENKVPIQIKGFGNFRKFVIFLNTNFPKKVRNIQKELVKSVKNNLGIKPHEFDLKWKPHATVAYGNTKDTFNIIWSYLKNRKPHYRLYFDNITILKKVNGMWRVHKIYTLK